MVFYQTWSLTQHKSDQMITCVLAIDIYTLARVCLLNITTDRDITYSIWGQ